MRTISRGAVPAGVARRSIERGTLVALAIVATLVALSMPVAAHPGAPEVEVREAAAGPFVMDLYRTGDFVGQRTTYWCIPSATQTMMNIIDPGRPNRSRKLQQRLYRVGDRLEEDGSRTIGWEPDPWRGMGISEWAGLLNRYGYGPYALDAGDTLHLALRKAAKAMRATGKPVGLVVWRGAHAWVMSGFRATDDPARTNDFRVTAVRVQDPWYPRPNSLWGPSRPPDSRVTLAALRADFLPYGRPGRRHPGRDGRFMLVLPQVEERLTAD